MSNFETKDFFERARKWALSSDIIKKITTNPIWFSLIIVIVIVIISYVMLGKRIDCSKNIFLKFGFYSLIVLILSLFLFKHNVEKAAKEKYQKTGTLINSMLNNKLYSDNKILRPRVENSVGSFRNETPES